MTEQQWLACDDPDRMLALLRGLAGERKLRLFALACCRRIRRLLDEESRKAVEVLERCADGAGGRRELQEALAAAERAEAAATGPARAAARAVAAAWSAAEHACSAAARVAPDPVEERKRQADLLRDVV